MGAHLEFPPSKHTVRVHMIDTTALMAIGALHFVQPVQPGHELINVTDVAFLIEHQASGKKVLFDLGVRKDYWNLPPAILKRLGDVIPSLRVDKDVPEILQEKGIDLESITSIVWSHHHWDHTGNPALFPPSTSITTGPGITSTTPTIFPGYPLLPRSPLSASDFKARPVHEITTFPLKIGSLNAYDYFSDGSFYLLDTPGHCVGHICGLARTSTSPDTFIFMGGDICHFAGDFRPSPQIPLPDPVPEGVLDNPDAHHHFSHPSEPTAPCPAEVFTSQHPRFPQPNSQSTYTLRTTPWYEITMHERAAYSSPRTSRETLSKMQPFDDSPHVLVCIAHDPTLLSVLPTLNKHPEEDLNAWFSRGWKEKCHWGWLNELPKQEPNGEMKSGRGKIVKGFYRNGQWWDFEGWKEGRMREEREREKEREEGKL